MLEFTYSCAECCYAECHCAECRGANFCIGFILKKVKGRKRERERERERERFRKNEYKMTSRQNEYIEEDKMTAEKNGKIAK